MASGASPSVPITSNRVAVSRVFQRLQVHLRDERAGRVQGPEPACAGLGTHRRRHAVRREDDHRAAGDVGQVVCEHRALAAQVLHHVPVVHDLVAHVDGGAVHLERHVHDVDGAVHAGAEAARRGEPQLSCAGPAGRAGLRGGDGIGRGHARWTLLGPLVVHVAAVRSLERRRLAYRTAPHQPRSAHLRRVSRGASARACATLSAAKRARSESGALARSRAMLASARARSSRPRKRCAASR